MNIEPPLGLLAELTHRCPMQCAYCSNPLALEPARNELSTREWHDVFEQAAAIGVLQLHLSGGEPAARRDLAELVAGARSSGLFTNLITSGLPLTQEKIVALKDAGLEHVQLSIQDSDPAEGDRVGGVRGALLRKRRVAEWVTEAGLPLTVNVVIHRHNISRLGAIIRLAESMGAQRLEVAHAQYYGWGLKNRAALLPTRRQVEEAGRMVANEIDRQDAHMRIDYVVPDQYARYPKACMAGWGRRFLNVTPAGNVLPCHAAETIPGMAFDNVRHRRLGDIWNDSEAFNRFRGSDWMPERCQGCERRTADWGGCRCQALSVTGNAAETDPACRHSPWHEAFLAGAESLAMKPPPPLVPRRMPARGARS